MIRIPSPARYGLFPSIAAAIDPFVPLRTSACLAISGDDSAGGGVAPDALVASPPDASPSPLRRLPDMRSLRERDAETQAYRRLSDVRTLAELRGVRVTGAMYKAQVYQRFTSVLALAEKMNHGIDELHSTVAIGDIHGNAARLSELLASEVVARAGGVVFLGDYFDRAEEEALEVFKMLKVCAKGNSVFLWGNHEIYFMLMMMGDVEDFAYMLKMGGGTFFSAVIGNEKWNELPADCVIEAAKKNPLLNEIYEWLYRYGQLHHVDIYNMFYSHAGLGDKTARGMNVQHLLACAASDLQRCFAVRDAGALNHARDVISTLRMFLNERDDKWVPVFSDGGPEGVVDRLLGMGVSGAVYGHDERSFVRAEYNRLFGSALMMGKQFGNLGGLLEIGPSGICSHRFMTADGARLRSETLVPRDQFRAMIAADLPRLLQRFQSYFQECAANNVSPRSW